MMKRGGKSNGFRKEGVTAKFAKAINLKTKGLSPVQWMGVILSRQRVKFGVVECCVRSGSMFDEGLGARVRLDHLQVLLLTRALTAHRNSQSHLSVVS
jgi:hypothetical protein